MSIPPPTHTRAHCLEPTYPVIFLCQMSTLCHEILNVLSSNEHVAEMMAKDPTLRAAVVGEVRRQLFGWKSAGSGEDDDHGDAAVQVSSTEQALETTSAEDDDVLSVSYTHLTLPTKA